MAGHLQGTLALTKRVERFQILHATLMLIGGVRRVRPEYCRQAISSFPLHTFYNDALELSIGLSASQILDIVIEQYPVDTVLVTPAFTAMLLETLNIYETNDTVLVGFSALTASFIESIEETAIQTETVAISIGLVIGDTNLIDNVLVTSLDDNFTVSFGNLIAVLEDI